MEHLVKNRTMKDYLIRIFTILTMFIIVFSVMEINEATNNKNPISKNPKIKSMTINNETVGGLKGTVEKSKSGTTIYLKKGVYKFNNTDIKIGKTLTIIGKGSAKDIVIDARKKDSIFEINSKGKLTLINVTLTNGKGITGVGISNSGRCYVYNSVFKDHISEDGGSGIYNYGKCIVRNSKFKNNYDTYDAVVGSAIHNTGKLTVTGSKFLNPYGKSILIMNDDGNILVKNNIFRGGDTAVLNTDLYGNSRFVVLNNVIHRFSDGGICNLYSHSKHIVIKSNKINNCDIGIYSEGSYANIRFNTVNKVAYGIIFDGNYNIISKNKLTNNKKSPSKKIWSIWQKSGCKYNKISNNVVKGFYLGIVTGDGGKYNLILKNKVIKSTYGIYVELGHKTNRVSYNTFLNNKIGLVSNYKFKNKSNIFVGNEVNIKKVNHSKNNIW